MVAKKSTKTIEDSIGFEELIQFQSDSIEMELLLKALNSLSTVRMKRDRSSLIFSKGTSRISSKKSIQMVCN